MVIDCGDAVRSPVWSFPMAAKIDQDSMREVVVETDSTVEDAARKSRRQFTAGAVASVLLAACSDALKGTGKEHGKDQDPSHGNDAGGSTGNGSSGDGDARTDGGQPGAGDGDGSGDGDSTNPADASSGTDAGASESDAGAAASDAGSPEQPLSCVVRPEQTEGPYFVDERLLRSDIRADPAHPGTVSQGVEFRLKFGVYSVADKACTPIENAIVDIWHCDALGVYSDVQDSNGFFDTRGQKFLRGYQLTDTQGFAKFVTVFPGWYTGRTVHIHFKIRTNPDSSEGFEFTSQIYFADGVTDALVGTGAYAGNDNQRMKNNGDGIFRDGGDKLTLQITKNGAVFHADCGIGLKT
jgi:protocatechuate 3,4-dioxygenase beta subunit